MERIKSGVPGLDGLMEGGVPKGSITILAGNTGSGKTIFGTQFIHNGAVQYNEKGVYATLEEDAATFKENMRRFGFNLDQLEKSGKIMILDHEMLRSGGLDVNLRFITEKMRDLKATRLVIDSLTAFLAACEEKLAYRSALYLMHDQLKGNEYTTLMTVSVPSGSQTLGMGIEEFMADGVIQLENVVQELEIRTRFVIRKMRGTGHSRKFHRVMFLPSGLEIVPFTS
ncbi:MAG: AAA family ATPase [Thaumarchaeota archaeon]|nr:AAA family ATPase [Nitrososphaerota archaeon]